MSRKPLVSIVIATHNRRDVLLNTLARLEECGLPAAERETLVVDNASTDGTRDALRGRGDVRSILLHRNLGSCAKAAGVEQALADIVLFLDDDSYPRPGCLHRMISRFERDPRLGALGFAVRLTGGGQECSALPHVFVGCGAGIRASAMRQAGGLDTSFFMQAEEYDLSFRLVQAGFKVEIVPELQVDHLKAGISRVSDRTTYYDIRNNLRLIGRYLPDGPAAIYKQDWRQRYEGIARSCGNHEAFEEGLCDGSRLCQTERAQFAGHRLGEAAFEQFFCWERIQAAMFGLRAAGIRRVAFCDLSKNLYAFVRGARSAGIEITAIADDRLVEWVDHYRGITVTTTASALAGSPGCAPDALVVSNTSYVHAAARQRDLMQQTSLPVVSWFSAPSAGRLIGAAPAASVRTVR